MHSKSPSYARVALRYLKRADPVLAGIIERVGPYRLVRRSERFQALVRAIIFQQLAGRAAQTIYDRFVALYPRVRFPSPQQVLATDGARLKRVGLSRQKSLYVKDLATQIAGNSLNFHRFTRMDDEEIIVELTRVKGIGRWTAEMFLMFNLGRPDVLPVDDLGLRNAVMKVYELNKPPAPRELREFGERWRPYRTVAAWYLWQSSRIVLPAAANGSNAPLKRRAKAPLG